MLCQDCEKRETCIELCAKAERYVDRDHVNRREPVATQAKLEILSLERTVNQNTPTFRAPDKLPAYPCLTQLQNKILHLFYFEGLTYAEIAMKTNRRVGAIRGQIHRAKTILREDLTQGEER